jgi:catechol 2,3-dioxygenase-like lactoylglutathione lyase family enzyme
MTLWRREHMNIIKKCGIHLKVSDFAKSRAFYEALGFQPNFEYGPGLELTKRTAPENYRGVTFAIDDDTAFFEIADGHLAVKPEVFKEHISSSKVSLMVQVDSLEEITDRAKKAGIPLAKEPVNYHWGTTEIVIRDPDGFILVFVTRTREEYKKAYPSA